MKKAMICFFIFLLTCVYASATDLNTEGSKLAKASTSEVVELVPLKNQGIKKVFISSANEIKEQWPAQFPSGTEKLQVVLIADINPPYGVGLDTMITSKSGKLKIEPQGGVGRFSVFGSFYITQDIVPSAGKFEDGVYHCVVKLNGVDIAKFSWSVGSKKKA
ncbi:MAG: hypothetical protein ABIJ59_10805 [Pseudomonadota bacterium]